MFQQIVLINTKNNEAFASGNSTYLDNYKYLPNLFDAIHDPKNNKTNPNFEGWSSQVATINDLDYQIITGITSADAKNNVNQYISLKKLTKISTNQTQAARL